MKRDDEALGGAGWFRWAALAVMVALVAVGCGGGDDDGERTVFGRSSDGDGAAGVDAEDLEEMLDDVLSGDADPDELVEDLKEQGEAMAEAFGDDGGGRVEINGETIDFESSICFDGQGDFTIEGLGEDSEGTPVWVSISYSVDSREELAEFFDETMLESLYGDAEEIIDSRVSVDWGRDELYGSAPDGEHRFETTAGTIFSGGELEFNFSSSGVSGSGEAQDLNFVSGDFEDRYPFTFEAACS